MSYDISIHVKAEGCDIYPKIAEPEYCSPTFNLREMFAKCMDWDYSQYTEKDGNYETVYYRCDLVLPKIKHGITELRTKWKKYEQYNSPNGWGTVEDALLALESLKNCIIEQSKQIPLDCLYMRW